MQCRTHLRRPVWVLAVLLLLCAAGTLTQAEEQGKATQQNPEIDSEVVLLSFPDPLYILLFGDPCRG